MITENKIIREIWKFKQEGNNEVSDKKLLAHDTHICICIHISFFQPVNSPFTFDIFILPISDLRAISIWRYCANRKREGEWGNEYIFLLRLYFNGWTNDGTVRDKQTNLGQEIRFEKSYRHVLFMVLESECREDIPFVHDVFYRVIKPKAKSTIFELSSPPSSALSLF